MNEITRAAKATAVVVTYQSADTLEALFTAAHKCCDANALQFVFVDNDSKDATPQILQKQVDWAEVVLTGKNNGFGRGCNIGLAKVTTPYTLFLNPDAQIEPEEIEKLVDFMDSHPNVGIVGPATACGAEGRLQGTSALPTPWTVFRASIPLLPPLTATQSILPGMAPFRTGWVCGAVFLIRTDLARRLGGFDPRFFLYWEEMDICHRASDIGFETWAVGNVMAKHICGASSTDDDTRISGCIGKDFYQSRRYYMIKHHGWFATTIAEFGEYVFLLVRVISDVLRCKGLARIRPRMQARLFSQPDELKTPPTFVK